MQTLWKEAWVSAVSELRSTNILTSFINPRPRHASTHTIVAIRPVWNPRAFLEYLPLNVLIPLNVHKLSHTYNINCKLAPCAQSDVHFSNATYVIDYRSSCASNFVYFIRGSWRLSEVQKIELPKEARIHSLRNRLLSHPANSNLLQYLCQALRWV